VKDLLSNDSKWQERANPLLYLLMQLILFAEQEEKEKAKQVE